MAQNAGSRRRHGECQRIFREEAGKTQKRRRELVQKQLQRRDDKKTLKNWSIEKRPQNRNPSPAPPHTDQQHRSWKPP
jgi:hypothetical protein